jgi:hypothetical protein
MSESQPEPASTRKPPPAYVVLVVGSIASVGYYGFVYLITLYAYRVNVWFGLFWSLALALVGLAFVAFGYQLIRESQSAVQDRPKPFLIPLLNRFREDKISADGGELRRAEITFFVPIATLFISSWASLAYGFAMIKPEAYVESQPLTFWRMCWHYVWQLIDMIPLIDAWKIIHVDDPILEVHIWPGMLVIAFRLIILLVIIDAASRLFGFSKKNQKSE